MFYFDKIDGKKIMRSDMIKAEHFFTTRQTIIKTQEPALKNLVELNKKTICEYLKINAKDLISPQQTHSSNIQTAIVNENNYPETDGIILANPQQAVFLNFADCTPIILYDEVQNIGAVIHAGWRGTVEKISVKAVRKMIDNFGSKPENIVAVIGPAISVCCYNVGSEVFEKLQSTVENFNGLYEFHDNNTFVNLKGINAQQLKESGIFRIDVCPYCTCCDNDLFFSYRKENATTNRHSALLKLNLL